jgi:Niemann-Pick C1 protein
VDVELVGALHYLNLSFNAVTAINMLLAIGIAVDYSAFIAYSFMDSQGTRNERARKALSRLGVAVFNGGFTVFLAIVCCAAAQSYIFRTFFKVSLPQRKRFADERRTFQRDRRLATKIN